MKNCLWLILVCVGCTGGKDVKTSTSETLPVFSLAVSEYPSWASFPASHDLGFIQMEAGKVGPLETKWGIDLEIRILDYDTCLNQFGGSTVDAACLTNTDVLNPALSRKTTAILPTSTSFGGDACVAVGIENVDQLRGQPVYGLEKSVSQYTFTRCLQKLNLNPADFEFKNQDPAAASQAMQTGQPSTKAIMVWNPFVLQSLRTRSDAKRIFDSTLIPDEIVDMVVIGDDVLQREKGADFAGCITDVFYSFCREMQKDEDATYAALGERFAALSPADMRICCQETKFYSTPDIGVSVFTNPNFPITMNLVTQFSKEHGIVEQPPRIGYDDPAMELNFSTVYMRKMVQ